ncbi:Ger(x)C family spore germination protein [Heliobacterium chlorum]|uniref:Ger(X)C family spore germination protein n=1 Tax=Heliobacterium chlorum TaxID=2698 RepID=A0ABR7T1U5_HELCL|nr:Ger(x)C family spore germination protein [Heliobacterium chlorum]MBC9784757.1 Ger(x)C family spore germination protein [Heliobacterium chlorum]
MGRILVLCLLAGILTGCYDQSPIERRALVMVIGFDKGEDKAVAIIPDIHNPKQSDANTQVGPQATAGPAILAPRLEGDTIEDAIESGKKRLPRILDFGLTGAIVISERAAREGIFPFLSWSLFQPTVRNNAFVMVTPSDLQSLFTEKAKTIEGTQGGNIIVSQLVSDTKSAGIARVHLWEAYRTYLDRTGCITTPYIRLVDGKVSYDGAAVFHYDKMVGRVDSKETALMMMVLSERTPYLYTFHFNSPEGGSQKTDPQTKGQANRRNDKSSDVTLRVQTVKRTYQVERVGPKQYRAVIKVDMDGMLTDANPPQVRYSTEDFEAMGDQATEAMHRDLEALMDKTQKQMGADVFHIGRYVRPIDIEEWRSMDWHEVFPTIPVEFDVKVRILGATR